jgi:pSer/pThr/pTyr-binding forkhead associated (FHA) protein
MAQLIMRRGPKPGTVFPVDKDVVTVGSGSRNDIVILDNDVSREHCKLVRKGTEYELYDLDSRYGTFVSGQRVRDSWKLTPGTIVELGDAVTLEFEQGENTEIAQSEMPRQRWDATPAMTNPDSHPSLVLLTGTKPGTVYPLRSDTVNLGRDLSNDILIQDPEISRFHLRMRRVESGYEVEDLKSTNGVLVNGERLTGKRVLRPEDVLQVGTMVEFRYTWSPDNAEAEKKAAPSPSLEIPVVKPPPVRDTTEANILGARSKLQTTRLGTGLDTGELVGHVFIAYAREEWESIVVPLTMVLQDAGINTWVDQYLTQGGDDWMIAVEQALAECWLLLVVVSPQALGSRHVPLAYRYFYNREKPIVSFVFRTVSEMPPELTQTTPIQYDIHNLSRSFESLIATIKEYRNKRRT